MDWLHRLLGRGVPEPIASALDPGEEVVASGPVGTGGHVAVTALGLWVPGGQGVRRVGWHRISKATWAGDVLTVVEAEVTGHAGQAELLADRRPARFVLPRPGRIPHTVRLRVEGSIRDRYRKELSGGGAWFVVRKIPGEDRSVLQVRPDPGTDAGVVAAIAEEAARKLADPEL
ncbi:hypothetical protein B0I33_106179 [Prauserella shujinwangii]|uniref:Uncharacterized protein n=1 Tax=Prauserella shujinwangii TaxID=1453103 RepID=A0A2T0LTM1_9PSEU|nr:hypothetical protein [Prauserella shujinwangii]PRX47080.1 hypothetical protein B0I33_106179 [Prauserella shujinwangii]